MSSPAIEFLPFGALIRTLPIGPKNTNIVLGFPAQEDYQKHNDPHFGLNIGRYANRIANGTIENLNGRSYQLEQNNATNTLHGGVKGWGRVIWDGPKPIGLRPIPGIEADGWSALEGGESVKFTYRSPHNDMGFPGTVDASIIYTSGKQKNKEGKEATVLAIEYEAVLVDDESGVQETCVNLTNHSYFNLNPAPAPNSPISLEGTTVTLADDQHLPLDSIGVPTDYKATKFPGINAGEPFTFTRTRPAVDDNFLVKAHQDGPWKLDTRGDKLEAHVTASHADTKLNVQILSTEPSYQFYTGLFVNVPEITSASGEKVPERRPFAGFCCEPSRFVNAVNRPEWRDQVVLKKGETYGSRIVYRGWSSE